MNSSTLINLNEYSALKAKWSKTLYIVSFQIWQFLLLFLLLYKKCVKFCGYVSPVGPAPEFTSEKVPFPAGERELPANNSATIKIVKS